ncbi:MAG: hypothetical protein KA085_12715 [Phenylobacterium sp.]|uniref:hypothetical protein n=1 Tax=Phenylobacterium sp. TaxID=1871053 RepID=UPI001B4AC01A|nr:hypothetical protein [Phenylobacterium sp.]MBP7649983.1 hypothetical protein [Phenylobacterium sp.]MBP7816985.1 hypothetical protein [Phenylobacterium sp.]MBP9232102.1 hypothetical protein [Phenylobacterium sp.]
MTNPLLRAALVGAALALSLPASASASSDDAWADFQKEVAARCKAAATEDSGVKTWTVSVSAFGSQGFGMAVLTGKAQGGVPVKYVCAMNKQTNAVEVAGGEPTGWVAR